MTESDNFFTSVKDLFAFLKLPEVDAKVANNAFSFLVSRHFAQKIRQGDLNDPLLREILPTLEENRKIDGFSDDPVGDKASEQEPGILQKYKGRALIEPTPACSLHCRFCFRRGEKLRIAQDFAGRFDAWLSKSPEIHEIILSGGDPLMMPAPAFGELMDKIAAHTRIDTVRIHSRIPVTMPQKLSLREKGSLYPAFERIAKQKKLVFVAHVDHPNELDGESAETFSNLAKLGTTLLNQTTLLKGVNDSAETLTELSFALFKQGVLPYYLHQLDHATGVAHFEVPDDRARSLMKAVRGALPGYLVPRFVREIAGEDSKHPLF